MLRSLGIVLFVAAMLATPAVADDRITVGGDAYVSGARASLSDPSARDAFLSGFTVDLTGKVEKDVSAAGFDVDVNAPVGQDFYAAGFSIKVNQPIAEDVTAAGFSIYLGPQAAIGGNARLTAGSVEIDAPIAGSVIAAAGSLTMNGTVTGDARLTAGKLVFGPNAKIGGALTYFAAEPITIPASVIAADRVHYEKLEAKAVAETARQAMGEGRFGFWPTFATVLAAFVLLIAFLAAMAAMLFAFAPKLTEDLRADAMASPFRSILLGILGLSMIFGLMPVSMMTLIGIPLMPIILLGAIALWIAGYLLGAYGTSMHVAAAFNRTPQSPGARLLVLVIGLVIIAALNFIPIIGWLINLAVVFLGLGAIVVRVVLALANRRDAAAQASTANMDRI
jgi:hypothetical protein